MKKIISIVLSLVFITALCLCPVSAEEGDYIVVEIGNTTVYFSADTEFTAEERAAIANVLAGGTTPSHIHGGDDPDNIICDIFGHKTTTEEVIAVQHCVYPTPPRCLQETYLVTTCSRCNYVDHQLLSSYCIDCHP